MGAELLARGLDKEAEFEADRDAVVLAARAGYDASAILATLERLQRRAPNDRALQLLFATHPAPLMRIHRLTAMDSPALAAAAVPSAAAGRLRTEGQ